MRRADEKIVFFGKSGFSTLAVNFGGGSDEDRFLTGGGSEENEFCFGEIGFDGLNGGVNDQFDTNRGRQVENEIGFRAENREVRTIGNGALDDLERGVGFYSGEVVEGTCGAIIDDCDGISIEQEAFGEV